VIDSDRSSPPLGQGNVSPPATAGGTAAKARDQLKPFSCPERTGGVGDAGEASLAKDETIALLTGRKVGSVTSSSEVSNGQEPPAQITSSLFVRVLKPTSLGLSKNANFIHATKAHSKMALFEFHDKFRAGLLLTAAITASKSRHLS
jgi:hypothetical protein